MEPVAEDVAESSPWSPFEAAYRRNLSVERLRRYRSDRDRGAWTPAIGRYLFNVEVARALVPALHWAEVCLRNHLDAVIGTAYPVGAGAERGFRRVACWLDTDPPVLLEKEQARVREAMVSFDRKNPPPRRGGRPAKALTPSRLLAELGFGFWTHLLDGAYENWRAPGGRRFWPALLGRAFPHCPRREKTRGAIHARFVEVKEIRNRTFHHERIAHLVSLELYDRALEAVSWIDPVIAAGVRDRDRPPAGGAPGARPRAVHHLGRRARLRLARGRGLRAETRSRVGGIARRRARVPVGGGRRRTGDRHRMMRDRGCAGLTRDLSRACDEDGRRRRWSDRR